MIYEFECGKGHTTEAVVPMGTKEWPCAVCMALIKPTQAWVPEMFAAHRILSPTRTTFVHADTGKRLKHVLKTAAGFSEARRG